ncbi:ROK family protein [Cohnella fermenti]|uniref:ROK family protein n=1 Tax=Cohnella fermenti TaxID=2565925 RepID=A0A4S4C263_9BACL|nr:ROK family protein [Cohnella fermenti]THF81762.1 ROK family protein [Cohnella fermenti]
MTSAAIGIDIGGTNIKAGLVAEDGSLLERFTVPTEADAGPDALRAKLLAIVGEAERIASGRGIGIGGVGVGTAGQVNRHTGGVAGATGNLPGWAGTPLAGWLTAETGLRVVVDNDVNMMAVGEAWLGAGRSWQDFVCLSLGTGIGGCLIMNGVPYLGRDGYAGELGHLVIQADGLPCNCGGQGCWEQYASVNALKRQLSEWPGGAGWDSPEELFESARKGDLEASRILDRYASFVAVGLTNVIHIFNPPGIVIGGAIVAGQGDALLERIRSQVYRRAMKVFNEPVPVRIAGAELGDHAGVFGAAGAILRG